MRVQPVRPHGGPLESHLGVATAIVIVVVAVAIAKPWGWAGADDSRASPSASLTPPWVLPTDAPRCFSCGAGFNDLVYDPGIFGSHEPPATWDLRPAAFMVTFGFVFNITPDGRLPVAAGPSALRSPAATPLPLPTDGGPSWPPVVSVPAGYHLFLFGIDMPHGYRLAGETLVLEDAIGPTTVGLEGLTSPWPEHFAVIGIPAGSGGHLATWRPGSYRLTLQFEPGGIERTIEVDIAR